VLDEKQQRIYSTVGALLEDHPSVAAAMLPISSDLKRDFRPPRRSDTHAAAARNACRDVTNISSSQPDGSATPARTSSLFSHTRPPHTFPQKASSASSRAAERLSFFDQFAFGASRGASRPTVAASMSIASVASAAFAPEPEEGADEYGFAAREDEEEAQAAMEAAEAADEADDEGTATAANPFNRAPRRPNFLQRSSTGGSAALSRPPGSSSAKFFSPPSNTPRSELFSPPAGASPAAAPPLSPSPPPASAPTSRTPTASKYFSAAPRMALVRLRHPGTSISSLAPPPAPVRAQTVPDASSFLHPPPAPATAHSTAHAVPAQQQEESDGEGRISDLDDAHYLDDEEEDEGQAVEQLHAHILAASRKRSRAAQAAPEPSSTVIADDDDAEAALVSSAAKRFKSPLVSSSRVSLSLSGSSGAATAASPAMGAINFDRFVRQSSSTSSAAATEQRIDARTPSPTVPPPAMLFQNSAAAAQPFRPLSVTPNTSTARFTVPAARAPARSTSLALAYDAGPGYSSPPSDVDEIPSTPPSPTPSPRANPSPLAGFGSSSVSPSPPPVSAPYVAGAAAGFSSQPEDADELLDEPPQEEEAVPLPAARAPAHNSSSFFAQFRYAPAATTSRVTISS